MPDLIGLMISGGPVIWLLSGISVLSLGLIVWKTLELRPVLGSTKTRDWALKLWHDGDRTGAMKTIAGRQAPADRLLYAAFEGLIEGQAPDRLEQDLSWRGNAEVMAMGRWLRLLDIIAMISPLLGLLGTVLGMIRSFQDLALAEGAANASILAGGIWQALLTTAAGLIVAIPAAVASGLLAARVDRAAGTIEASVGRALAMAERPHIPSPPPGYIPPREG